jgi:hypothetical protein
LQNFISNARFYGILAVIAGADWIGFARLYGSRPGKKTGISINSQRGLANLAAQI